ncbi:hypothetical protein KCP74_07690 [Salmonella enterica subsp. enterica]|nr:hypothetical protein KCP74_07690 [Salmonella enterica subsp. enterica]
MIFEAGNRKSPARSAISRSFTAIRRNPTCWKTPSVEEVAVSQEQQTAPYRCLSWNRQNRALVALKRRRVRAACDQYAAVAFLRLKSALNAISSANPAGWVPAGVRRVTLNTSRYRRQNRYDQQLEKTHGSPAMVTASSLPVWIGTTSPP